MLQSEAFKEHLHPALDSVMESQKAGTATPVFLGEIRAKNHLCILFQVPRERRQLIFCPSFFFFFYFLEIDTMYSETDWAKKHHLKLQFDEVGEREKFGFLITAKSSAPSYSHYGPISLFKATGKLYRTSHDALRVTPTWLVPCCHGECRDLP